MEYLNRRKWIRVESEEKSLQGKILDLNGIRDKEKFLKSSLADLHNPLLLTGVKKAVQTLKSLIQNKGKIVLYTDYDTDGACGGAVAYLMLKEQGANVSYYANNRTIQGYGLCESGIDEIRALYPDVALVLTIDNGITAIEGANYCKKVGLPLIITDHHEPGEMLPKALAVVNPKRKNSKYPFQGLCGTAVIWKILKELYKDKKQADKYLDIVATATVGDVVPLIDENRILVKEGLRLMNDESRTSLKILKQLTKTSVVTSDTLGFSYSPIFNAVSRLEGRIEPIIDFLVMEDENLAEEAAKRMIAVNEIRKEKTASQYEIAEEILKKQGMEKVIVLYDERFEEGIVGLIAGKLKEIYNRPAFIFADSSKTGEIKGSVRSVPKYHAKEVLDDCKELLLGYGGHELAGGLSLKMENLPKVKDHLIKKSAELLSPEDYVKKYYYIDSLLESQISFALVDELRALEPYGEGFRKPLIRLQDFYVKRVIAMGSEKQHLKLQGNKLNIIAFGQVKNYEKRGNPLCVTALGYPEINVFNNNASIQFMVDGDNFM